ncbi:hypothetical protein QOT17_019091 [Balamuthia mandrillaris]
MAELLDMLFPGDKKLLLWQGMQRAVGSASLEGCVLVCCVVVVGAWQTHFLPSKILPATEELARTAAPQPPSVQQRVAPSSPKPSEEPFCGEPPLSLHVGRKKMFRSQETVSCKGNNHHTGHDKTRGGTASCHHVPSITKKRTRRRERERQRTMHHSLLPDDCPRTRRSRWLADHGILQGDDKFEDMLPRVDRPDPVHYVTPLFQQKEIEQCYGSSPFFQEVKGMVDPQQASPRVVAARLQEMLQNVWDVVRRAGFAGDGYSMVEG